MDISLLQEVLAFIEKQQTLLNEHVKDPENAKEYQDIHMKIASKIIDDIKKSQELNDVDLKYELQKDMDDQRSTGDSGLDIEENFIKLIEEDEEVESHISQNGISVLQDKDDSVFVVKDITNQVMNKSDVETETIEMKSNKDYDTSAHEKSTTISENKQHVEDHNKRISHIINVDTYSDEYVPDKYLMKSIAIRSDYKFRENRKSIDLELLQSDEETKPKKKLKEKISLLYKCELCGESSKDQNELKTHVQKHNAKVLYSCKVCGQLFPWLSTLCQHIVRHKKEREQHIHKQPPSSAHKQHEKGRKRMATHEYGRASTNKRQFSRNHASKRSQKHISLIA